MKITSALCLIAGIAAALAIFITLDMNFHPFFKESGIEPMQRDLRISPRSAALSADTLSGYAGTFLTYLMVITTGAFMGKCSGNICIKVIKKLAGKAGRELD